MLLFSFVTHGIYVPFWFSNRKDSFNSLNSHEKISSIPIVALLIASIISAISDIFHIRPVGFMATPAEMQINIIYALLNGFIAVIILIQSFKIRRILNMHYDIELSAVATFFFTIFYLQYKINRLDK